MRPAWWSAAGIEEVRSAVDGLDGVLREILEYQQNQVGFLVIQFPSPCPADLESHPLLVGDWHNSRQENLA